MAAGARPSSQVRDCYSTDFPPARELKVEGSGHHLLVENPALVLPAIDRFLSEA